MRPVFIQPLILLACMLLPPEAIAAGESELTPALENPGHEPQPDWFKVSFLDLYEDIDEAANNGKRLMVYFFQDGCPYCRKLLEDNFGQREINDKARRYFDVVSLNIWGDREVTVGDRVYTEKQLAAALKVQYTPTLIFFDENNRAVYRANGYYPPERFDVVLDYAGQHREQQLSFQDYLAQVAPEPASGRLHDEINTLSTTSDLAAALKPGRHLLVMFEQRRCTGCDELHLDILKRPESVDLLKRFDIVLLDMWSDETITTPGGKNMKVRDWAKKLDINYAPSLVFFNDSGEVVFRIDAYLKAFHVQSVMDYVSSNAYQRQPGFQRYIDERADRLREQGVIIDLMK